MSQATLTAFGDYVRIIWTIASKDIIDAMKNRVVVSMILMLGVFLLVPRLIPLIMEEPQTVLPLYDAGDSRLAAELRKIPDLTVQKVGSERELAAALCGAIYPEIGLMLPEGLDLASAAGEGGVIQGYVCWGKRHDVADLRLRLEGMLSKALGRPASIQLEGNVLYPPSDGVLFLGIATVNAVLIMLAMGIFLVPSLLLEEKETKTMQALLVSPASIGQVVAGKALAGAFYVFVAAVMFAISWAEVIHWDVVLLFAISSGFFSVAVGLTLGSLFGKQQDMVGWVTAVLLLLTGAVLVAVLGVELPFPVSGILPWVPSVALAEVCRAAFSGPAAGAPVLARAGVVLMESLPLYGLVIWRVRHSDR